MEIWVDGVGIEYEADLRHAEMLVREVLGKDVKSAKTATTPGVRNQADAEKEVMRHIGELKKTGHADWRQS